MVEPLAKKFIPKNQFIMTLIKFVECWFRQNFRGSCQVVIDMDKHTFGVLGVYLVALGVPKTAERIFDAACLENGLVWFPEFKTPVLTVSRYF